jgi:hypothetical protein
VVKVDITVITNCAGLGRFAHASMRSTGAAIGEATNAGLAIEWILAANAESQPTVEYLAHHQPANSRQLLTEGDIREKAISQAQGTYLAIIDGNDLISRNWLTASRALAQREPGSNVFHPAAIIRYGAAPSLYLTLDQQSREFSHELLFAHSIWPSTALALRDVFINPPFPYVPRTPDSSTWQWNRATVDTGIIHRVVPDTFTCCHQTQYHDCILDEPARAILAGAAS